MNKNYPNSKKEIATRFIYALVDPRDSRIRYVGCSYQPRKRLSSQVSEARRRRNKPLMIKNPENIPPRLRWINDLDDEGERPLVVILECCSHDNWRERENSWIIKLHEAGARLTNLRTAAGDENIKHPEYKHIIFLEKGYELKQGY